MGCLWQPDYGSLWRQQPPTTAVCDTPGSAASRYRSAPNAPLARYHHALQALVSDEPQVKMQPLLYGKAEPFYLRYHVVTEKLANDGAGDLSSQPRRLPRIEHRIGVGKKAAEEGKLILVNMLEIVPVQATRCALDNLARLCAHLNSYQGIPH